MGDDQTLTDREDAGVSCPSCGAANLPGSRFCSACGKALRHGAPVAETRKTVTVLFCDATSSTSLGEQLDPESLRGLMTRYFDAMREAIEFHGGVVEKFIGDAVMAVFGVPTVHEDDALRACRAAVEIRDRLASMDERIRADRGDTIVWRMGINTGEVVAGDVTAGQRMVTGDAVNVAARLEAAAEPGTTLLGGKTYALVRESVVAEAVEPLVLKGKAEPVPAWRLTAVSDDGRRAPRPLAAPLVGRRRPLRLLNEALREAVEERVCHLFTILGVAGVGKSRLVGEFTGGLGEEARVAAGRCLAYGHGITYWPVVEAIRAGLGLSDQDGPEATSDLLRRLLGAEPEAERVTAVVRSVIGIESAAAAPDETFWALRKTFEAMARSSPLILVFDDVHWGEPTFLDFIEHMADWTRDAPILLIAMARAELLEKRPAWGGGKRWVTSMSLEPLSELESDELVSGLLGQAQLPAELRTRITSAAEGNPLFVEEVLAKLIDDGFLVPAAEGWSAAGDLAELTIPLSIQALLAARLDGLGAEERTVIERASVEGKVFHRGAVTELAPEPIRAQVRDRLASLMRMELVRPEIASFAGDEAFGFRHLLIRDAAYQALAKQTRSELHERFAAWLQRVAADRLAEYQEIIGYHLEQAYRYRAELGPPDEAARALGERAGALLADAGERSSGRGDSAATVDLLERAIDLLPEGESRRRRLAFLFGRALYEVGQAGRAESVLEQAISRAKEAGDQGAAALSQVALLEIQSSTRSIELSGSWAEFERLAGVLERSGDLDGARMARAAGAFALFALGRASEATATAWPIIEQGPSPAVWYQAAQVAHGASVVFGPTPIDEAIARIRPHSDLAEGGELKFGPMIGIARLLIWQGRFDEAREMLAATRRGFEELGNRHRLASVMILEASAAYLTGDLEAAVRLSVEAYEALIATGDRSFASTFALDVGRAMMDSLDLDGAWRFGAIARETSSTDDVISQAGGRAIQARVLAERGEHDRAIALAQEAEAMMSATDYLVQHGEVTADLARVLRAAGRDDEATAALTKAASLYQAKGATVLENRARRVLAEWSS